MSQHFDNYLQKSFAPFGLAHQVTVVLTHAEIQVLPTTYIMLVAGRANRLYVPQSAVVSLHWVADYTNIHASAIISIDNEGYGLLTSLFEAGSSQVSSLLASGEDYLAVLSPLTNDSGSSGVALQSVNSVGKGLRLVASNPMVQHEFFDGDPANTLTVSVTYLVLNTVTGLFE